MDRRPAAPWLAAGQLNPPQADPRSARPGALPQVAGAATRPNDQPRARSVLETANIKLSSVASDVLGKSGRDMLAGLLAGGSDVEALADLARGRLRAKLPALREALDGRVEPTHRILLRHPLHLIALHESGLERIRLEIDQLLLAYQQHLARLMQ